MDFTSTQHCQFCGLPSEGKSFCCDACELLSQKVPSVTVPPSQEFKHLDSPEFKDLYRQENEDYNYLFHAEGLHCSSCVHILEKMPEFYEDLEKVRVNFGQSTVAVQLDENGSLAKTAQLIKELGYTPSLISAKDNLAEKYKAENRKFLNRIAIAGFCAGNTMLFVVPVYAGLDGGWATIFNWLSFALFLPILFYSAIPFYQGAWASLKYHHVSADLPIVLALWSGFLFSTYNLVYSGGPIYFDSTASFLFLILSARYLLKRVQQNYLAPARAVSLFKNEFYKVADSEHSLPWNKVRPGQELLLSRLQSVPADSELLSQEASLDLSLFNGESLPRNFTKGMMIYAGSKLLNEEARIRVLQPFESSKLGELFNKLDQNAYLKSHFGALSDRLAQKLIITVFAAALIFFIIYYHINAVEAFNRSLALIVLACPCALAFGTPLALGLALKKAQRLGILIKNSDSLEKILNVRNVFFDKTGTLTEGHLGLAHSAPQVIQQDLINNILAIENQSVHPVAFALRKTWKATAYPKVESFEEIFGQGVRGSIQGDIYEIKALSDTTHDSELAVEVFKNGHTQCRLYFNDEIRDNAASLVKALNKRGLHCFILSGDKNARVREVAKKCGIAEADAFGELFPEDKLSILQELTHTCMIGDGANDALSLQRADVGIAVKGSLDISLQSADVYFTRTGLESLLNLFDLAEQSRKILIRNLILSLIYNMIGAVLALTGFINPMMAAILMPISSLLIIASSFWGFR
ncbi:MAG TPA: heavy metal translocating P-type ATPase [Bdellovibrio sp.]|uniref:heavy metal translocating P-type ATPase n=1 Tax=Bdellovibrio sp. TaxID=28201 RepID=UPI002F1CA3AB